MHSFNNLIPSHIQNLSPYLPGEQPISDRFIKLNTNENPFPPSPYVLKNIRDAVGESLRFYPHPTADALRKRLAKMHKCEVDQIIIGNGSDELLSLATRAFVLSSAEAKGDFAKGTIQYFTPSYSLYPVLCEIRNARANAVSLTSSFGIPTLKKGINSAAALTFFTTPHSPSGRSYSPKELRFLCEMLSGILILDEAYVDFADGDALSLVSEFPNVIVSRTFSKAYSLCALRVGYFIGNARLIDALNRIRDSYNVNALAQIAALATLEDLDYYRKNLRIIIEERDKLTDLLSRLGFKIFPSSTNFILIEPPKKTGTAAEWQVKLRAGGFLVRWFSEGDLRQYLRVSIGNPKQNRAFEKCVMKIVNRES